MCLTSPHWGLDEVIADLEIADYATTTLNISAVADQSAPQKRTIVIIARNVADTSNEDHKGGYQAAE